MEWQMTLMQLNLNNSFRSLARPQPEPLRPPMLHNRSEATEQKVKLAGRDRTDRQAPHCRPREFLRRKRPGPEGRVLVARLPLPSPLIQVSTERHGSKWTRTGQMPNNKQKLQPWPNRSQHMAKRKLRQKEWQRRERHYMKPRYKILTSATQRNHLRQRLQGREDAHLPPQVAFRRPCRLARTRVVCSTQHHRLLTG